MAHQIGRQVKHYAQYGEFASQEGKSQEEWFAENAFTKFDKDAYTKAVTQGTEGDYLTSIGLPEEDVDYFKSNLNLEYIQPGGYIEQQFESGVSGVGEQVGKSLFDISEQVGTATETAGFAGAGGIKLKERQAREGMFGEYTRQVEDLALSKEMAISDFSTQLGQEFWQNLGNYEDSL